MVATTVHLEELAPDVVAGLEGCDFLEVGGEGRHTVGLQLGAVHADVVEGGDLVGDGALLVLHLRDRVDDAFEVFLCVLVEDVEGAVARMLAVEGIVLHPAAAGVLIEVVLEADGGVEVVQIDARGELGLLLATGSDNCHSSNT